MTGWAEGLLLTRDEEAAETGRESSEPAMVQGPLRFKRVMY
jgi:hypothetical protein